jgi:amyotrophic lateral sclerosis 2 protein
MYFRYINIIKNLIKLDESKERSEQLQDALKKWEAIPKEQRKRIDDAESTKKFWEGSGKIVEQFKSPERRIIRESRSHPISLFNASIFSSHWFILLTDIFIHITGTSYKAHLLQLLWVELLPDSDTLQVSISLTQIQLLFHGFWLYYLENVVVIANFEINFRFTID